MALPVDPEKKADPFYRYKMAPAQIKEEGKGNGKMTVICNLKEIAERLDRPPAFIINYISQEFSTKSTLKGGDKWFINGWYDRDQVQTHIYSFIEKFVLCKSCRNPETIVEIKEEDNSLWLNCKACAEITAVDPTEKLNRLILKTVQQERAKSETDEKSKDKKDRKEKEKKDKAEGKAASALLSAGAAVSVRDDTDVFATEEEVRKEQAEQQNPVQVLQAFIAPGKAEDADVVAKVFDLKADYRLSDKHIIALIFEAYFTSAAVKAGFPEQGCRLLKRFVKEDTVKEPIRCLELLCNEEEALVPKFPIILKRFYDGEVLPEEAITEWFHGKPAKKIPKAVSQALRTKTQPFIEWLSQAEDESEEESDD